jgi:mycofactocin system glycosyltransferase
VRSLLELDYPADCREIIVVDDASEPPLAPWLADLPIRLLRQEHNIGQSAARNLAAAEARGTVLAFIDNDCVAEADWLRALVPYLNEPAIGIVGGKVAAPPTQGPVAAFEAVRSPLDMGTVEAEVAPGAPVSYLPTCNLLVRRELLLSQGGFDAGMRLGEDVDFIWRTLQTGARACYVPAGRIVHEHRVQLGALLRRRADYGSSEADLQRRHPQGRRVMPLPLVNLLLLLMLALLPDAWPLGLAALGLVGLELIDKQRRLKRLDVLVPLGWTIRALGREHAASLYHLSANVVRYYSLPLLILGGVQPGLLPVLLLLFLVAPVGDYRRRRPNLSLPRFVSLYWLEMAAYQLGVWRGCWRRCTLRPLLPKLKLQR